MNPISFLHNLMLVGFFAIAAIVYSLAGPVFHLDKLIVKGDGAWLVSVEELRTGLQQSGPMSLVFGDFNSLEQVTSLNALVRSAQVTKEYPNKLILEVKARQPVARNVTGGLVDSNGEWYEGSTNEVLPIFAVEQRNLPLAVALYNDAHHELNLLGLGINQLRKTNQGWLVFLTNGWILQLGKEKLRQRLNRFVNNWSQLSANLDGARNLRFDLRYPHGMAVAGLHNYLEKENGKN